MQPPQGPFPVYQGFTPALQYPGQQQQQLQAGGLASPGFVQHGALQHAGWPGAAQQYQQQPMAAAYQPQPQPAAAGRVMRPTVARPPPPAAGVAYPPQFAPQQPVHGIGSIMRPMTASGTVIRTPQMGAPPRPPPPSLPPPTLAAPSTQHSHGIMQPQRHAQPPPPASLPGVQLYNPNTGAPIPQLPGAAAPVIMRNPNTGAPIYPPGHNVLLMQSVQSVTRPPTLQPPPPQQQQGQQQQQQLSQPLPRGGGGGWTPGGRGRGGGRPVLAPPARRQRQRDVALPPEKITEDPVARAPASAAEAAEVEQWIQERRRSFPTSEAVLRREAEAAARRERGELDASRSERQQRLAAILAQQSAMGLSKAAGTLDMFLDMRRRGGGGRGRGRHDGGGGGRGGPHQQRGFGWESFVSGADPPEPAGQQALRGAGPGPVHPGQKRGRPEGGGPGAACQEGAAAEPAAKRGRAEGGEDVLAALAGYGSGDEGSAHEESGAGAGAQQQLQQQQGGREGPPLDYHGSVGFPGGRGRGGRGGRGERVGGRGGGRFGSDGGRGRGRGRGGRGVSWEDRQDGGRGRGRGAVGRGGRHAQQQQQGRGRGAAPAQPRPPRPAPPSLLQKLLAKEIRQDRSYLLQAFRFFVRNNFLLDWAAGKPLELPPPPAYPTPPKLQWGRGPEGFGAGGEAGAGSAQRPADVRALLAAVAGDAVDVELSDEEEGLLLPGATDGGAAAAAAADGEGSGEEESEEASSSGSEAESEEGEEEEEGQLLAAGSEERQDVYVPALDADEDVDFS